MDARSVKEAARRFGADLVGITSLKNFEGVAPEKNPLSIFSRGKSMIVIGRRISRGTLRAVESGSVRTGLFDDFGLKMLEDQFLAKATYDLVIWMESAGFEAVPMFGYDADAAAKFPLGAPVCEGKAAPNVYVNYMDAAALCGLGEVGKNGLFITPEFGTLQRFAMLITDAELESDPVVTRNVCDNCNACVEACPLNDKLCAHCTAGALQTGIGRFYTIDKIAAACGRACMESLEKRQLIDRKSVNAKNCQEVK